MKSFYSSIENILTAGDTINHQLRSMRDLLKDSLSSEDFQLKCIDEVIGTIENWTDTEMLWNAPALFYHPKLKFSVRVIFWPAFYENNPHKHKTWAVTGVLHNNLNFSTYDLLSAPPRLKRSRYIIAQKGEVGYLVPDCIHNVNNPSHELSASVHIFNNIGDGSNPEENAIWYPAPRKHNMAPGMVNMAFMTCLCILRNIKSQKSLEIIKRIYDLSAISIKLTATHAMYMFDHKFARRCFDELEPMLYEHN